MKQVLDKNRVANNFNTAASSYDAAAILQRLVSDRLIERLDLVKLKPELLLDLGSGTGASARQLQKRYRRSKVIELDVAYCMLRQARQADKKVFNRHFYIQGDAEALPLKTESLDLVFSNLTLQWCNDIYRYFSEILRTLKPAGYVIFSTFGPATLNELRNCWASVDDYTHINSFLDMHDIGDVLTADGYEDVVLDMEMLTMTYKDCLFLMHDLKNLGAQNALQHRQRGLTGKHKLKKVIDNYENYRHDGSLPATFEIIYGHAWKPDKKSFLKRGNQHDYYVPLDTLTRRQKS